MNASLLCQQVDEKFREYLHGLGKRGRGRKRGTHHRAMILQVFLQNTKPVTSNDVLYQVKAVDRNISAACVYQTFKLLVQSGLVKEIIPADGSARLYAHDIAMAQCSHAHLVCKDCGAVVENRELIKAESVHPDAEGHL